MASSSQKATILPGRSVLHGHAAKMHSNPNGGDPGLVFCEMAHLGKLNMRADKSAGKIVKSITGCAFPPVANKFTTAGKRHVVWLGPDEFMILCEAGRDEELTSAIQLTIGDQHSAISNISDALAAFHLKGADVRQTLAKGCALDLHPRKFTPGQCAQTMLAHAGVTMIATDGDCFLLICRTSFAAYTLDWLEDAALEFGFVFKGQMTSHQQNKKAPAK